jgi:electron transport complex protein RnfD
LASDAAQSGPQPAQAGLAVGHWPHLRGEETVAQIMWSVVAALVPAAVAAGYFFGIRAYLHVGAAVATAVITEAIITRLRLGKTTLRDGSAVVTGLLVAFCLPAQARWFVPMVAAFIAIAIAKHCFGGLGCNIWNPALVGRAFVHISFPTDMNPASWPVLTGDHFLGDVGTAVAGVPEGVQAVTGASPLALAKGIANQGYADVDVLKVLTDAHGRGLWEMAVGTVGGSIGETSALLLVLGAIYLVYKGWVRWQIPVAYLGTVALGALLLPLYLAGGEGGTEPAAWQPILFAMPDVAPRFVLWHLLGGGLVLGALYMATDMVTTPITNRGMLIFGAGCGLLTILIRLYGGYPEAVCYSILLMNTATPLIDRWTQARIFGHKR